MLVGSLARRAVGAVSGVALVFAVATATVAASAASDDVVRLSGASRYDTSAAISAAAFQPGVPVAYVANGMNFPDALSGAPAAGAQGAPVLLTEANALPPVIHAELDRLNPGRIVVLGGRGAVSDAVFGQLDAYTDGEVERLSGSGRFDTSAAISAATFDIGVPVAYIANGMGFPDALSGAPAAGSQGGPVLLSETNRLPDPIRAELTRLQPERIVVLGGKGAVSDALLGELDQFTEGDVTRLAGTGRYDTSAAISAATFSEGVPVAYLASGLNFPDALSGAPAAGSQGGPVLLTPAGELPAAIKFELQRLKPARIVVLGGKGAVTEQLFGQLDRYLPTPQNDSVLDSPTISRDTTWSAERTPEVVIRGALTIEQDATLTIGQGVVVKMVEYDLDYGFGRIEVEGELVIEGSAQQPVVLTGHTDASTGAAPRDVGEPATWNGVTVRQGGDLAMRHAELRGSYGITHFTAPGGDSTVIEDSKIEGTVRWGPVSAGGAAPTWSPTLSFKRNTLTEGWLNITGGSTDSSIRVAHNRLNGGDDEGRVAFIDTAKARPSRVHDNTGTSDGWIQVSGELAEDWTLGPDESLDWGFGSWLRVPVGTTLEVLPGTHVRGGLVYSAGAVRLAGTEQAPVRFSGSWGGVAVQRSGTLHATHVVFEAEHYGYSVSQTGILGSGWGDVTVLDSELAGGIALRPDLSSAPRGTLPTYRLEGNTLDSGIEVGSGSVPNSRSTIRDNAIRVAEGELALAWNGSGRADVDSIASNAALSTGVFRFTGDIDGDWQVPAEYDVAWSPDHWRVVNGATVSFGEGARFSTIGTSSGFIEVSETAQLRITGTDTSPIQLPDGLAVNVTGAQLELSHVRWRGLPSYGDGFFGGLAAWDGASVNLDDVTMSEMDVCIRVSSADVTGRLRGNLSGCDVGIDSEATIDATQIDWGHPSGPAPFGTGSSVRGYAKILPWAGYIPTPVTITPSPQVQPRCSETLIIAVRGSGEAPGGPPEYATDPELYDDFDYDAELGGFGMDYRGLGMRLQEMLTGETLVTDPWGVIDGSAPGMLDAMSVEGRTDARVLALNYPASSTDNLTRAIEWDVSTLYLRFHPDRIAAYLSSILSGVDELKDVLDDEVVACPDQDVVLLGYSQGAMIVRMALTDLGEGDPILSNVAGVALLADPMRRPTDWVSRLGSAPGTSEGLVAKALTYPAFVTLIDHLTQDVGGSRSIDDLYPHSLRSKTVTICNEGDALCDPSTGTYSKSDREATHGYSTRELPGWGVEVAGRFGLTSQ